MISLSNLQIFMNTNPSLLTQEANFQYQDLFL
jgi:hypothetical protein